MGTIRLFRVKHYIPNFWNIFEIFCKGIFVFQMVPHVLSNAVIMKQAMGGAGLGMKISSFFGPDLTTDCMMRGLTGHHLGGLHPSPLKHSGGLKQLQGVEAVPEPRWAGNGAWGLT